MLIDVNAELENYRVKLDNLNALNELKNKLPEKDRNFASSLIEYFINTNGLSGKQWDYVNVLVDRVTEVEPIYGDFDAIQVMFRLAGEHLKSPKIRLLTKNEVYVELRFSPETKDLTIYRDGWAGHGKRKLAGWIKNGALVPYSKDMMTEDMKLTIQEFSLDPMAVSKAMANKLGCCIYCGRRLADPHSKELGYGKTCAKNYGLKY